LGVEAELLVHKEAQLQMIEPAVKMQGTGIRDQGTVSSADNPEMGR
jgi:hypothetical protein